MAATVKRTVATAGYDYMRATYGERVWTQILETLVDEDRALVEGASASPTLPVAVDGRVFEGLVAVQFNGDRNIAAPALRKGGSSQADAMLDGLFSIFARFVSPQQAFNRGGSIITSVYSGGVTSSTELSSAGNGGAITIVGLGESSFVSPWQCGWIERALARFGGTNPEVAERSWQSGLDASHELIYEASWE